MGQPAPPLSLRSSSEPSSTLILSVVSGAGWLSWLDITSSPGLATVSVEVSAGSNPTLVRVVGVQEHGFYGRQIPFHGNLLDKGNVHDIYTPPVCSRSSGTICTQHTGPSDILMKAFLVAFRDLKHHIVYWGWRERPFL